MPRLITLYTPAAPGLLALHSLHGKESLDQPFDYDIATLSTELVELNSLLGSSATVEIQTALLPRYINGLIVDLCHTGMQGRFHAYRIRLASWLYLLQQNSNCRIFQDQSIPEIVKSVFSACPLAAVEDRLTRSYPKNEYIVQYNESDYDFASRLMQEAGIAYHFVHQADSHILRLCDHEKTFEPLSGLYRLLPYRANDAVSHQPSFQRISEQKTLTVGTYAANDFYFKIPSLELKRKAHHELPPRHAQNELYRSPARALDPNEIEQKTLIRLEEAQSTHHILRAESNDGIFTPGAIVGLSEHPNDSLNQDYLVTATQFSVTEGDHASLTGEELILQTMLELRPANVPYRPALTTPRPDIGLQTAIVTGPAGEEIYTDEHGRVKVQFHWDREGQRNEHSSCWMRVAQAWAGAGWGSMFIPRIGSEVIVQFLHGDANCPIITASVHNAESIPPGVLPAKKTQTAIRSKTHKGNGFNELRFDDQDGSQQIFLHAQKDLRRVVNNDHLSMIGHDETHDVVNDQHVKVHRDSRRYVGANHIGGVRETRYELVGGDYIIKAGSSFRIICGESVFEMGANGNVGIFCKQFNFTAMQDAQINTLKGVLDLNNSNRPDPAAFEPIFQEGQQQKIINEIEQLFQIVDESAPT